MIGLFILVVIGHGLLHIVGQYIVAILTIPSQTLTRLKQESITDDVEVKTKRSVVDLSNALPLILSMLTNLGAMTVDKIHSTLTMFSNDQFRYNATVGVLKDYLDSLVIDDVVGYSAGLYNKR
jgi:hypothetical protein